MGVKFKVKFGNKQIYKSKKIYKKGKECVDIKNLADDLARVKVEIVVEGGLPKKKKGGILGHKTFQRNGLDSELQKMVLQLGMQCGMRASCFCREPWSVGGV